MFHFIRTCLVCAALLTAVSAFGQKNEIYPESTIFKIESNENLTDGPTDAHWENLAPFTAFFDPWEEEPAPATALRMCHDGSKIYFRWDVVDSDVLVKGDPSEEMDVCDGDRVEFFLDASDRMSRYYCLELDPSGRVLDYRASYYRQFDYPYSMPGVTVHAQRTSDGYRVSGSLDLPALDRLGLIHTLPTGRYLRIGFFRAEFTDMGADTQFRWISWKSPGTPQPDFHVPSALGWVLLEGEE